MAAKTGSRNALSYGWALGENNWNTGMDNNLTFLDRFGVHLSFKSVLNTPPGAPAAGDCYVVGAAPTGAWVGKTNQVAVYDDGAWRYGVPRKGWAAYDESTGVRYIFGVDWDDAAVFGSVQLTGGTSTQGTFSWNADEETVDLIQNGAVLQLGQETQAHCRNNTGSTILNGTVVMAAGTAGLAGRIKITPMDASSSANAKYLIGLVTQDIANGADGKVTVFGKVRGLNTSAWSDGDVLWCDPAVAGGLTATKPATGLALPIAFVVNSHATLGTLMVRVTNVSENLSAANLAGTKAQFDAACSDDNFAYLGQENTFTQPQAVSANSASAALKVTQTGDGNAFVVEDEAADGSPFTIDALGRVGVGQAALAGTSMRLGGTIGGSANSQAIRVDGTVQSDATGVGRGVITVMNTVAASFATSLSHFQANQGGIGAGSSVTSQYGFDAAASLVGATYNYGFHGGIPAGTNRYNFYGSGTAPASFAGDVQVHGASGRIGYAAGAGGTVTQATNRTTGVTLNRPSGAITLVSAAGSASWQTFTVTNSTVAATDTVKVCQKSGTDKHMIFVTAVAAGSFDITFATTGGTTTEQPVFNFAVTKGATS